MNINKIIAGYREAFGEKAELSHSAVPMSCFKVDVPHHAQQLSVRYLCMGKNQRKNQWIILRQ